MEPIAGRVGIDLGLDELRQGGQRQGRTPLGEHGRLPHLALEKDRLVVTVSPDPILAPAERAAAVKDVKGVVVEIDTRGPVLVAMRTTAVNIGVEMRPGPLADRTGQVRVDDKFDLSGLRTDFPDMCHVEGRIRPDRHAGYTDFTRLT